jgi:NADPH:quinone reductase-like Zn-dependent oxidoreductase
MYIMIAKQYSCRIEVHSLKYPIILGLSFAGIVEAVGGGADSFSKGDPVAVVRSRDKVNDAKFGAFQQYALVTAATTTRLSSR